MSESCRDPRLPSLLARCDVDIPFLKSCSRRASSIAERKRPTLWCSSSAISAYAKCDGVSIPLGPDCLDEGVREDIVPLIAKSMLLAHSKSALRPCTPVATPHG